VVSFEVIHMECLTQQSRIPLENLVVAQLVTKFCAFYGSGELIIMFIRALHRLLSGAR
jgi:hypothetical protein